MPLILASASQRRVDIFQKSSLNFKQIIPNVKEIQDKNANPLELVKTNALLKAESIAKNHNNVPVIAADTVVLAGTTLLGKPNSFEEALEMFELYRTEPVKVYSGLALLYQKRSALGIDETSIKIRKRAFEAYKANAEKLFSLDKAGGFTIEGMGALLFDSIEGSYYNVLGFPLHLLDELMNTLGLSLWDYQSSP